ncbi:glucosidase 2 subunit beta-like isoform X1 [Synchiropus splendidus]|uniref:glucosidase 2 subunit beta-like isoform X1 n=1 Tax=Synchiropus splendidus TaxID=270530 RepID=UPI00237E147D|nr:glucosidase 2 subunit beta-like isoform X1 [Synchiropus splendidus]
MHSYVLISAFLLCGVMDARKIRGISSSYKRFYRERRSFLCIDGSKVIPFEHVNDDYCDCEDGSDEPGTSACSRGRFYCTNLGFRPHYIPSSRVNDGICDCCDTSDEYNSHAQCHNSCWNLGQRERAYVEGQMKTLDEGLRLKQQLIEDGVVLWREKQAQLRGLQQLAEDLQVKLEECRRRKHEAERLKEKTLDIQLVRDAGYVHTQENSKKSENNSESEVALEQGEEQPVIQAKIKGTAGGYEGEDPLLKAAARAAEQEVSDLKKVEEAYETVNMEISELQKKLAIDYGVDWEFLYLNNQCYELSVHEYSYSLCPFSHVTQKSNTGTEVSLGKWGMWTGTPELYSQMIYENGEPCWQGGSRSTTVTLTCGTETGLRLVKEPSKCQYIMDLQTPVACQPVLKQRGIHSEL